MTDKSSGARLRADIDAGRTGDKVDFPDPAAAPLATDAEAGGQATRFAPERRAEAGQPRRSGLTGFWLYLAFVAAIAAMAIILVWLATSSR
ncbi:hypothetical protein [Devosia salina]|uniref:Uncharacterized protein n=1 Tax=Devosia salina TaxID=2860336 RepID=A0ABX8WKQ8_9HYPH|nr:hypothetical protein [Devosia salina]QYO79212.1 hypothetical protein K1X15_15845 [Devosia salina]